MRSAIPYTRWWARMTLRWINSGLTLPVRYEDLVVSPTTTLHRVIDHCGIKANAAMIAVVVDYETKIRRYAKNQFNRGLIGRYREEMTREEIAWC